MGLAGWSIGVILAVAASFCAALGDNLIKRSFVLHSRLEEEGSEPVPMYKRPLLVAGNFCNMILNTSLNLASFAFVDASITIPFGGLHIVLNLPLAKYMNGEEPTSKSILFNAVILAGVTITLLSGNHDSKTYTVQELESNLFSPVFVVFTLLLSAALMFSRSFVNSAEKVGHKKIALTVFAGLIGSFTQVFAKSMSTCMRAGAWDSYFTWTSAVCTIVFALTQVYFLNKCLDRYEATFVVPIVNSVLIVVGSLYAAVFFKEMERWDLSSRVLVPVGICVTAFGIASLASESVPSRPSAMSELSSAPFEETLLDPDTSLHLDAQQANDDVTDYGAISP